MVDTQTKRQMKPQQMCRARNSTHSSSRGGGRGWGVIADLGYCSLSVTVAHTSCMHYDTTEKFRIMCLRPSLRLSSSATKSRHPHWVVRQKWRVLQRLITSQYIAYRTCSADACPEALVHRSERRPIRARWCVNDPCLCVQASRWVGKSLSGRTQSNKCVMW